MKNLFKLLLVVMLCGNSVHLSLRATEMSEINNFNDSEITMQTLSDNDIVVNDGTIISYDNVEATSITETASKEATNSFFNFEEGIDVSVMSDAKIYDEFVDDSVIGIDNRVLVSDTTKSPYSRVVYIVSTYSNGERYRCSGSLIAQNVVLTAAHCFYDRKLEWASSIEVYPGISAEYDTLFGSANGVKWMLTQEYINKRNISSDFGIIKLDRNKEGPGYFGLTSQPLDEITLTGYPSDKTFGMYTESGKAEKVTDGTIWHKLNTAGGASGSPIYNRDNQVTSVHTCGNSAINCGSELTVEKVKIIYYWMNNDSNPTGIKDRNYFYYLNTDETIKYAVEYSNNIQLKVYYFYPDTKYDNTQWQHVTTVYNQSNNAFVFSREEYADVNQKLKEYYEFYPNTILNNSITNHVYSYYKMNDDETIKYRETRENNTGNVKEYYEYYSVAKYGANPEKHIKNITK